ncbi:MAG: zinc-ribbon domain-containing protein [Bacteroidota bacterium]
MIIYGTKTTPVATENIADSCTNCQTANSILMRVLQKYVHIFFIPFIPVGKTGATVCAHCKHALTKEEFSGSLNSRYDTLKSTAKTPIWTFSGLALLAILVVVLIVSDKQKKEKVAALIQAPQSGDVYEIKNDAKQYTLYKIQRISGDTSFILMNQYETNKLSGLKDLKEKGDAGYSEDEIPMTKADFQKMMDDGEILDVERK